MKMKQLGSFTRRIGIVCAMVCFTACQQESEPGVSGENSAAEGVPVVLSANYPLHDFASIIGGDLIEATFIVPPEIDPAFWRPGRDDIERLQKADKVFLNGAGYEKWLPTVSLTEGRLVDTSESFGDYYVFESEGATHQHGPDGEHPHGGIAFTTWMDIDQAAKQAGAIKRALVSLSPENSDIFARNFIVLTNKLSELDREFLTWGKQLDGSPLVASHPVYQYFARRYSLNLKSVHWEPDVVPDDEALAELDSLRSNHPAKWMIWESDPDPESVRILSERGLRSVVMDPVGNVPDNGNVLDAMDANLRRAQAMLD